MFGTEAEHPRQISLCENHFHRHVSLTNELTKLTNQQTRRITILPGGRNRNPAAPYYMDNELS